MRLLFATEQAHLPQRVGGAGSSIHDLAVSLARAGHEVAVAASIVRVRGGWLWAYNKAARIVHGDGHFTRDHVMGYAVYRGRNVVDGAARICELFHPSIVLVQGQGREGGAIALAGAYLQQRIPTIMYLRDVEFAQFGKRLPIHPLLAYIGNSSFTSRTAEEQLGKPVPSLPPLVRREQYETAVQRRSVVFINPVAVKGVEIALRLAEARPDIPFEFIECWNLPTTAAKARAKALGNIKWRRSTQEGHRIFQNARIVLVPSLWHEAWARVVTEAHISGIPVLASNRGGLPESVGPGGILIDPQAPFHFWVEALSSLWDDAAVYERYTTAAAEYARRPEIQPVTLIAEFLCLINEHLENCGKLRPVAIA